MSQKRRQLTIACLLVLALLAPALGWRAWGHPRAADLPPALAERETASVPSGRGDDALRQSAAQAPATPDVNETPALPSATTTATHPPATATSTGTATPTLAPTLTPTLTPTVTPTLRPTLPFTYTVKEGDTLWDLAIANDIDVDSLVWANERLEEDRDYLFIGQFLVIPPVIGALHTVAPGDSLSSIATFYKVKPEAISGYAANSLQPPYQLRIGQVLVIPGGVKPLLTRWVTTEKGSMVVNVPPSKGLLSWPTAGLITQYFSRNHLGIDIGNALGTPILAAADGVVISVGEKAGGYGLAVMIDHGDGYGTLYAHLQSFAVAVGDSVARGQKIGEMGNTGRSTGPHLHFSLYYYGGAVNPIHYLP